MIHIELWQSETMAELTRDQRLLFIGLFSNADDQGRLRGHPKIVQNLVFPYDTDLSIEQTERDLDALVEGDFIIRYGAGTKSLIQVKNWWTYQQPQWAYPSSYPPPKSWHDCIRGRKHNKVYTENWPPPQWNRKCDAPDDGPDDTPTGEALGKDIPNRPPNGDRQGDSIGKDSSSNSGSAEIPNGAADAANEGPQPVAPEQPIDPPEKAPEKASDAPQPPQNLAGWEDWLAKAKNKQAIIRRFILYHYPEHAAPTYAFIAKTAKKLGRGFNGYRRLLSLLYQCEVHEPKGDLLPYVLAVAKNDKANAVYYRDGHDQQDRAPQDEPEDWPEQEPPSPLDRAWQSALVELRGAFGVQPVARWFRASALLERANGHAKIGLADEACVDWVENRWKAQLADVLRGPGGDAPELEFVIVEQGTPDWLGLVEPAQEAA